VEDDQSTAAGVAQFDGADGELRREVLESEGTGRGGCVKTRGCEFAGKHLSADAGGRGAGGGWKAGGNTGSELVGTPTC